MAAGVRPPARRRGLTRAYKILDRAAWEAAREAGRFEGAEIDLRDGYIHLSTAAQAAETVRLHFRGRADLVLLELEAGDFDPPLRWEPSRGGQLFPHLYGPLDVARVRAVHEAPPGPDGAPAVPDLPA